MYHTLVVPEYKENHESSGDDEEKKSFADLCAYMAGFLRGEYEMSPWHGAPVDEETLPLVEVLSNIARTGVMLTMEGQPGECLEWPDGSLNAGAYPSGHLLSAEGQDMNEYDGEKQKGLHVRKRAYTTALIKTDIIDRFLDQLQVESQNSTIGVRVDYDTKKVTAIGTIASFQVEGWKIINLTEYTTPSGTVDRATNFMTVPEFWSHYEAEAFGKVADEYDCTGCSFVELIDSRWCHGGQADNIYTALKASLQNK
jgi:hypothetical protein